VIYFFIFPILFIAALVGRSDSGEYISVILIFIYYILNFEI